jgi:hypothetical protein
MSRDRMYLVSLCGVTAAVMLCLLLVSRFGRTTVAPPESLHDVADRAGAVGLHQRSDIESGVVGSRLIVSDQAITFERTTTLRFGDAEHPCWQGTVAACVPARSYYSFSHPDHGVVWGDVFLFGDPTIIRDLMAANRLPKKPQAGGAVPVLAAGCWGAVVL